MFALALALAAQVAPATPAPPSVQAPAEIIAAAPAADWQAIAPDDLLVMDLAPDGAGRPRRVVIQLIPAPFSASWVANIRTLARAHWWDGVSINRVQDNYVVQWGDPNGEDRAKAKPLPAGLAATSQDEYVQHDAPNFRFFQGEAWAEPAFTSPVVGHGIAFRGITPWFTDTFYRGFPFTSVLTPHGSVIAPIHCYGMVGVGRDMPPDAGTGAELYTVIGQAPRHLDRNIALVGRVIDGMEFVSSLPRGKGALGFYTDPAERVPIVSIRLASDLPDAVRPRFQYLSTESDSFARLTLARANRHDPFFVVPANGLDICSDPVPVRRAPSAG